MHEVNWLFTYGQTMNDSFLSMADTNFTNFSSSDTDSSEMPERQWSDYAEITFLFLMVLIGVPLNVLSILRSLSPSSRPKHSVRNVNDGRKRAFTNARSRLNLLQTHKRTSSLRGAQKSTVSQFKSLQIHLTVANLMIICVYGLSQICWLITIRWYGGDLLCRLVKFLHTFCFYATSNMVAMIAIDRLFVTIYIDRQRHRLRTVRCLKASTFVAWLLACCSSVPQAFFWRAYAPFSDTPNWQQCVTVWVAERHHASLIFQFTFSLHEILGTTNGTATQKPNTYEESTLYEDLYGGMHLALVFWFPALIVVCSYGVIVGKFHKKISQTNRETTMRRRCNRENEVSDFRTKVASWNKTTSMSEDLSSRTGTDHEVAVNWKCEDVATTGTDQSAIRLLAVPIVLQKSQAMALRRISKDVVAITTLTRAKRTTLRKTMWILSAYVLCWSPYNILELWRYFDTTFENSYLEFLSNLIVLNAVLNPLIYSI